MLGRDPQGVEYRDVVPIHLGLSHNQITDISPLMQNPALKDGIGIDLRQNPLDEEAYNTHIPALRERGVTVFDDRS